MFPNPLFTQKAKQCRGEAEHKAQKPKAVDTDRGCVGLKCRDHAEGLRGIRLMERNKLLKECNRSICGVFLEPLIRFYEKCCDDSGK